MVTWARCFPNCSAGKATTLEWRTTALQIAQRFKPDVAFLDIGLPVMNGYELARRLKALPGLAALRLIAITGHGQPADRQKAEAAGFSHHLVKPIDFDLLEKLLSEGE
jgi:CheY-like chemotaxis protein